MDRKLIQYLPPVLREVLEFQAINEANEPELALAWRALAQVMNNQFLESADESGVCVWEQELRIHPRDTDTLSDRKARIKELWNIKIPYTLPWLRRWLEGVCGPEGHFVDVKDYTLQLNLDCALLPDAGELSRKIMRMLEWVIPSNLIWALFYTLAMENTLRIGSTGAVQSQLPAREAADSLQGKDVLFLGGSAGTQIRRPAREEADTPHAQSALTLAGSAFAQTAIPAREEQDTLCARDALCTAAGSAAVRAVRKPVWIPPEPPRRHLLRSGKIAAARVVLKPIPVPPEAPLEHHQHTGGCMVVHIEFPVREG